MSAESQSPCLAMFDCCVLKSEISRLALVNGLYLAPAYTRNFYNQWEGLSDSGANNCVYQLIWGLCLGVSAAFKWQVPLIGGSNGPQRACQVSRFSCLCSLHVPLLKIYVRLLIAWCPCKIVLSNCNITRLVWLTLMAANVTFESSHLPS